MNLIRVLKGHNMKHEFQLKLNNSKIKIKVAFIESQNKSSAQLSIFAYEAYIHFSRTQFGAVKRMKS